MAHHEYKLDPAHSWTVPGFAWNCALKISKAELELITDPETFLFFENSIRGGISTISHRYAKANNKYLPNYDPNLPNDFLIYLDANNLYGYAPANAQYSAVASRGGRGHVICTSNHIRIHHFECTGVKTSLASCSIRLRPMSTG